MKADEIFSGSQLEYLNEAYAPKTVDDYLPSWEKIGILYCSNWIDFEIETEESKDALITLFIQYKAFQIPQMAAYSEDLRVNLNENLKQAQKRQMRNNQSKSSIYVSSSSEKFGEDFFGRHK